MSSWVPAAAIGVTFAFVELIPGALSSLGGMERLEKSRNSVEKAGYRENGDFVRDLMSCNSYKTGGFQK